MTDLCPFCVAFRCSCQWAEWLDVKCLFRHMVPKSLVFLPRLMCLRHSLQIATVRSDVDMLKKAQTTDLLGVGWEITAAECDGIGFPPLFYLAPKSHQ